MAILRVPEVWQSCDRLDNTAYTEYMATRSWFGSDKLMSGERLLRSAPARIRTEAPPHWWEGELILTSDRLFFLPSVDVPFLDDNAFWLRNIASWRAARGNRLLVVAAHVVREFELMTPQPVAMIARMAAHWARDIERARTVARPRPVEGRRAAG